MNSKWLSLIDVGNLISQATKMFRPKRSRNNWTIVSLISISAAILTALISRNSNTKKSIQKFINIAKPEGNMSFPNVNFATTEFSNELLPAVVQEKEKQK